MTSSQSILIAIEILITLLIVWGLIHEDKLIAFEKKIYYKMKSRKDK